MSVTRPTDGDGRTYRRIDQILVFVDGILPRPEPHTLDDRKHARLLAGCCLALKLLRLHQLALDAEDGLFYSAGLDDLAWRRRESGQRPFRYTVGCVDGCCIHSFEEVLRDDVDHTFASLGEVLQAVLSMVEAACIAYNEEWRVVVDDLGVRVWSQIRALAVLGSRANEANGSGDDGGDQEFVVECSGSAILVRIDVDVLVLQTRSIVIRTLSGLPVGVLGLGEHQLLVFTPIRTGAFYVFEIAVWVSLDGLLGVELLLVCCRVLLPLLLIG